MYSFTAKGYAVEMPEGWGMYPNALYDTVNHQFAADLMFSPGAAGAETTISIACGKLEPGWDSVVLKDLRLSSLTLILQSPPAEAQPAEVLGLPGWRIDYVETIPGRDTTIEKREVLFVAGTCGWIITLTAPEGDLAGHLDDFDAVVASFRLLVPAAEATSHSER